MKFLTNHLNRLFCTILLVGGIAGALPAQAAYNYTTIDYPGAVATQVFGVNSQGNIVGTASDGIASIGFVYNPRTAIFTVLPNFPGLDTSAIGINEPGVVVGAVTDLNTSFQSGSILDKGAFTIFDHPGSSFFTVARGINDPGLITGYADTDGGNTVSGFIYDRKLNSFIDFLPSPNFTIAHGINNKGEVVGNVFYSADEAFPGSAPGQYGFLRRKNGAITLFRVNGGQTRARGIAESGLITGNYNDGATQRGFVTSLSSQSGFQSVTVPAARLLDVPGATVTFPEGITNSGDVVGIWFDASGNLHGFHAKPTD